MITKICTEPPVHSHLHENVKWLCTLYTVLKKGEWGIWDNRGRRGGRGKGRKWDC